jgi:hypothetical protein
MIYVVCFLLGNSPASEVYMPTFRNTLFHLHRQVGVCRMNYIGGSNKTLLNFHRTHDGTSEITESPSSVPNVLQTWRASFSPCVTRVPYLQGLQFLPNCISRPNGINNPTGPTAEKRRESAENELTAALCPKVTHNIHLHEQNVGTNENKVK